MRGPGMLAAAVTLSLVGGCAPPAPGPALCAGVVCAAGEACDPSDGQCRSSAGDRCAAVLCPQGTTCDAADGHCKGDKGGEADLCRGVVCGERQTCSPQSGACSDNPPPPPLPAVLLDRVGRPGVSNLLLNPFSLFKVNNLPEDTAVSQDRYNAAGVSTAWVAAFGPYLRASLGIWDALDGSCGNQHLAGAAGAARYTTLGNQLAFDALHINTAAIACTTYFAAEVGAADCGGWRPGYDVIDTTYTLLTTGTINTPVGDGVAPSAPVSDLFPFLPPLE